MVSNDGGITNAALKLKGYRKKYIEQMLLCKIT